MIDTDKYEGHNTDGRIWYQYSEGITSDYTDGRSRADEADSQLIADAPLLLAEVKRLREQLKHLRGQLGRYTQFLLWVEEEHNEVFDEYEGKDEL